MIRGLLIGVVLLTRERERMRTAAAVVAYLATIVAANLTVAYFAARGHQEVVIYVAFGIVAATIVLRDRLHDAWESGRVPKMAALIAAGALLAWLANPDAARIAIASCAAFTAAETVDALVYHAARRSPWLVRSNQSNLASAFVDSVVFVAVAFPGFAFAVAFEQTTAKIAGGLLFSFLLARRRERVAIA